MDNTARLLKFLHHAKHSIGEPPVSSYKDKRDVLTTLGMSFLTTEDLISCRWRMNKARSKYIGRRSLGRDFGKPNTITKLFSESILCLNFKGEISHNFRNVKNVISY